MEVETLLQRITVRNEYRQGMEKGEQDAYSTGPELEVLVHDFSKVFIH